MKIKSAILITYDIEDVFSEAAALCDSAGYAVCHTVRHRFLKRPKYGVSEEIVQRLEEVVNSMQPDVVVFDEILKPSQNYNLASKLHITVLDREALILEIFESRASSTESRLQVKMAQLRYEMSRAREKVRLTRMGEQPGFMGIGKFEVDTYYNDIKHRMHRVKSKLLKAGRQRELHRRSRQRAGFQTSSLAGYTSAGKTKLFNRLTGEQQEQNKSLFTTLSTTTRRVPVGGWVFLISDTVGFISKLPAYMIDAFKSTLEELLHTDVVIVVVDISDQAADLRKKFRSCMKTLWEIGVEQDRVLYVLNKSDLVDAPEIRLKARLLGLEDGRKWIAVSAKTGSNIAQLKLLIRRVSDKTEQPAEDYGVVASGN